MRKILILILLVSLHSCTTDDQKTNIALTLCASPAISGCSASTSPPISQTLSEQVSSFFSAPFDTQWWPARWQCGTWSAFHGWLYIGSDLTIALAYFLIPGILLYFLYKRKDRFEFRIMLGLFILFILACGLTHVMDASLFWWPAYRLSALLRFATAIVSLGTAFMLFKITPRFIEFRSPEELEEIVKERTEELRKSMLLISAYQRALDESAIVAITDQRGLIKHVNDNFCKISKYSKQELTGKDHRIINSGYHNKEFIRELWTTITHGNIWKGELQNKAKDGTVYWVDTTIVPFLNEQSEPYQYVAIRADITKRKEAERALLLSESKFKRIFDSKMVGIIFWDEKGEISDANERFLEIVGYSKQDLEAGKLNWSEMTPLEYAELDEEALKQLAQTGVCIPFEKEYFRKDGSRVAILIGSALLENDSFIKGVAYITDITERKKAEEEIKQSNQLLENAEEQAGLGSWQLDLETKTGKWSKQMFRFFGLEISDQAPAFENYLEMVHPDDRSFVLEALNDLIEGRTPVSKVFRTNPDKIPLRYLSPSWQTKKVKNQIAKFEGTLQDITERQKTELQLINYARELERSNRELEQFAHIASHDLQEPLRMVISYLQLIEKRYKGNLDKEADEFIHYAVEGAARMRKLINDVLTFSRLQKDIVLERVNLTNIVEEVKLNLSISIKEANATINNVDLPIIEADQMQMVQLFQNLISNAIKFRREGIAPVIEIDAKKQHDQWLISVRDNGIGIEQEYAEKVFIIFRQLHVKSKYGGTGIGLAIAKKIVERHGGKIWFESEFAKGTTFFFLLNSKK